MESSLPLLLFQALKDPGFPTLLGVVETLVADGVVAKGEAQKLLGQVVTTWSTQLKAEFHDDKLAGRMLAMHPGVFSQRTREGWWAWEYIELAAGSLDSHQADAWMASVIASLPEDALHHEQAGRAWESIVESGRMQATRAFLTRKKDAGLLLRSGKTLRLHMAAPRVWGVVQEMCDLRQETAWGQPLWRVLLNPASGARNGNALRQCVMKWMVSEQAAGRADATMIRQRRRLAKERFLNLLEQRPGDAEGLIKSMREEPVEWLTEWVPQAGRRIPLWQLPWVRSSCAEAWATGLLREKSWMSHLGEMGQLLRAVEAARGKKKRPGVPKGTIDWAGVDVAKLQARDVEGLLLCAKSLWGADLCAQVERCVLGQALTTQPGLASPPGGRIRL